MRLENSFVVEAPLEAAWALLMDVPRVVPCMPGATLDEVVDDSTWKATMQVKLGPIGLTFATDVTRDDADEAAHRVRLGASAKEVKNRGAAKATIESTLAAVDGGTRVDLVTELMLTGTVAQYGRGMIQDVSAQLVDSFAKCLEAQLVGAPAEAERAVAEQAKPVSGLALFFAALRRAVARVFGRT